MKKQITISPDLEIYVFGKALSWLEGTAGDGYNHKQRS